MLMQKHTEQQVDKSQVYHSQLCCSHTSVSSNVCTLDKKLCELPSPFMCILIFPNFTCELLGPGSIESVIWNLSRTASTV